MNEERKGGIEGKESKKEGRKKRRKKGRRKKIKQDDRK